MAPRLILVTSRPFYEEAIADSSDSIPAARKMRYAREEVYFFQSSTLLHHAWIFYRESAKCVWVGINFAPRVAVWRRPTGVRDRRLFKQATSLKPVCSGLERFYTKTNRTAFAVGHGRSEAEDLLCWRDRQGRRQHDRSVRAQDHEGTSIRSPGSRTCSRASASALFSNSMSCCLTAGLARA
jgi:hypothetical protein